MPTLCLNNFTSFGDNLVLNSDGNNIDNHSNIQHSHADYQCRAPHPLELPEIRTRIGSFLCPKNLASCALVSRDWYGSFHPMLWADMVIPETCLTPTVNDLQKQAPLIRSLEIVACRSNKDYFRLRGCVNLNRLSIFTRSHFLSMAAIDGVPSMILDHSRSLEELELDVHFALSNLMWEAIGRCSRLENLKLHNVLVPPESAQPFLLACSRVAVLHLFSPSLPNQSLSYTSGPLLSGVRDLRLHEARGIDIEQQLLFTRLCPNLISFYWRRSGFASKLPIKQMKNYLLTGAWPHLHSLELFGDVMEDQDLACLLKSMAHVERWRTTKTGFGSTSVVAMERHFQTIREIDLHACDFLESPMIQYLLHSIPTLESFSADRLFVDDILRDTPWPCSSRLKNLKIFIDLDVSKDNTSDEFKIQQLAMFERLSLLREITVLQISRTVNRPIRMRALSLNINAGLPKLGSLRYLEELWFIPGQYMEKEDIEWIVRSFPRLRAMSFYMHVNYDKNEQLLKTMGAWSKSHVVRPDFLLSSDRSKR